VLARERFDVAHCHVSIVSPAAVGGGCQAHRLGVPTVLTFHSVVPHTRLLATGLDLLIHSSRWPAAFSAVSARVARDVQPLAGNHPIRSLPNGVDREFWRTTSAPRPADVLEIVSVMRLNAKKRPVALLEMMGGLVPRLRKGVRARLRVAGDGPLRARITHEILRRGMSNHVELLGAQTREQLRDLFAASDLFVLPTVRESFGLAAVEARCAGLPVVAMAASGVSEVIAHDREGLLARSDAEFLDHVLLLARDPVRREAIAAHNRATSPTCDWQSVLRAHLDIYSEAIALRASKVSSA
jgi:glycosyltransferase involved in cell wall biosynthesis